MRKTLQLAPVSFRPVDDTSNFVVEQGGLGCLCPLKEASFVAPLRLAEGAVIERIAAGVRDRDADGTGTMALVRTDARTSEVVATTPASADRGEDIETLAADTPAAPAVDAQHAYLLRATLSGPDVCLCGAEVRYR